MTDEKREEYRIKQRDRLRLIRKNLTPEQREAHNKNVREKNRRIRANW